MTIDDLAEQLRASDAKAAESILIDPARVRARGLRAAGSAMTRLRAWLCVEVVLNGVAVVWLGDFLAAHPREARFVLAAVPLEAMVIAHVVFGAWQIARFARVDFASPVVAIQRKLEHLRAARVRMTKWTILLAPLLWIPLLVVALEGFLGVDGYRVLNRTWLVANVLFGVAFVPAMAWASKRFVDRFDGSPALRGVLRAIAGHSLASAQAFLDDVARLEGGG